MESLLDEESNALEPRSFFAEQQFCDLGQMIPPSSIKKCSLSPCWTPSTGPGTRDTEIRHDTLIAFQEFRVHWEVRTNKQIITGNKYCGRG